MQGTPFGRQNATFGAWNRQHFGNLVVQTMSAAQEMSPSLHAVGSVLDTQLEVT